MKPVIFIYIFLLIFIICCSRKQIIFYSGCENPEILQDLFISIDNNRSLFNELGIEIVNDTIENKCGYLLINGDNNQRVKSVITDVDLMIMAKDFFN